MEERELLQLQQQQHANSLYLSSQIEKGRLSPDIVISSLREILRCGLRTPSPLHFARNKEREKANEKEKEQEKEANYGFIDNGLIPVVHIPVGSESGGERLPPISEWIDPKEAADATRKLQIPLNPAPTTIPTTTPTTKIIAPPPKKPLLLRPASNNNFVVPRSANPLPKIPAQPSQQPPQQHSPQQHFSASGESVQRKSGTTIVPSLNSAFSSIGSVAQKSASFPYSPLLAQHPQHPQPPQQPQQRASLITPKSTPLPSLSSSFTHQAQHPQHAQHAQHAQHPQQTTTTTTTLAFGVVQPHSSFGPIGDEEPFDSPPMLTFTNGGKDAIFHSSRIKSGTKRKRTTNDQLNVLENAFNEDPLPSKRTKERLAEETGLTLKRIQIWFQNRRAKQKKSGEVPLKKQHIAPDEEEEP